LKHALASLAEISGKPIETWDSDFIRTCLNDSLQMKTWIYEEIYRSRAKDYKNPFKQMVYDSYSEMETVIGKLEDNTFIRQQKEELNQYQEKISALLNND
jgi:ribonuclease HIII